MRYLTTIFCAFLLLGNYSHARSFEIPRGTWQRIIGDVPVSCQSNCPNRGIALGGFGAGSFMYNISGSFGPWADEVGEYSKTWLKGAAFHVYERKGEEKIVKCLAIGATAMSAWNQLQIGDGTYYALQPKGWCVYHCFNSDVSSQFFSPIIANNYRETSYPVAVWQFEFSNPTAEPIEVSVMFTWPNPCFNGGSEIRTGFTNTLMTQSDTIGIVLKANNSLNTPETQNSEWCIATKQSQDVMVSYASWNIGGDGADIWDQFSDDGLLSGSISSLDSAVAIAVKAVVPPGGDIIIPFVLSWDFPVVEFNTGHGEQSTQWWKKYCEYFDTLSDNSFDIAAEALQNYQSWESQIDTWMSPFINDAIYPDWLICAAFNELYYNQFGGSFWESGLRSGHPEEFMGLHSEDHKNFIMEAQQYTLAGNINVGHYSSIVYAKFWPEMERDLLRCHADVVMYYDQCSPTVPNQTSPEIGSPRDVTSNSCKWGDPFFILSPHGYRSRPAPCADGDFHPISDNSAKFIQQCWRYFSLYNDMPFLQYVWPAVESTYQFMKTYDCESDPKDSLPYIQGYDNTYDGWKMVGTTMYDGGFWVGALEAMDTMAAILNKPIRNEVQAWLGAAKRNLDSELWDPDSLYYRIDTHSAYPTAVFTDALCGQRYCEEYALPDILPRWKMNYHLQKVYGINVSPNSNYGAKLGRMPDGTTVPGAGRDKSEYWVGVTYYVAAMMYHAGLKEEALNTASGAYHPVYADSHLAYWFNTPEAWNDTGFAPRPGLGGSFPHQYLRPGAVWELMFEMQRSSPSYQCGDVNADGVINLGDVVYLITYLYKNGPPPIPLLAGDCNCSGIVDLGDVVFLISYLYKGGPAPGCQVRVVGT